MKWSDLKNTLGQYAPLIGTAIGGPGGALVGSLVSKALGVEESPEAVAAEIKRDPQAYLKIRELESNERTQIQKIALETLETELKDVQNARATHRHSAMPAIICCALTVIVGAGAALLFFAPIPEANSSTAYLLFGTVLAKWGDSIAYWVGTTRSSAVKTQMVIGK